MLLKNCRNEVVLLQAKHARRRAEEARQCCGNPANSTGTRREVLVY